MPPKHPGALSTMTEARALWRIVMRWRWWGNNRRHWLGRCNRCRRFGLLIRVRNIDDSNSNNFIAAVVFANCEPTGPPHFSEETWKRISRQTGWRNSPLEWVPPQGWGFTLGSDFKALNMIRQLANRPDRQTDVGRVCFNVSAFLVVFFIGSRGSHFAGANDFIHFADRLGDCVEVVH